MESPNQLDFAIVNKELKPGLYLGATPIGNLGDITLRVLHALRTADELWAEDTRNLRKLLSFYNITLGERPAISCHDHNEAELALICLQKIRAGRTIVYVSDAGMPLISDPGYKLVEAVRDAKLPCTVLPGASSVLTALALAGAPSDQFAFYGFVPVKPNAQNELFEKIRSRQQTAILFESPKRLIKTLEILRTHFGDDHKIAVARELTKTFEEAPRDSIINLMAYYRENPLKGEIVLVIWPFTPEASTEEAILNMLAEARKTQSLSDAVKDVAQMTGWPRKKVYALALDQKG